MKRPSFIAAAEANDRRSSCVAMRPFMMITSAHVVPFVSGFEDIWPSF